MKELFYHSMSCPYTEYPKGVVVNADCTGPDGLQNLKDGVAEFVCNDPPFGVTEIDWDDSILDPVWMRREYFRVIDPSGVIAIFGSDGFLFDLDRKLSLVPSKDHSCLEERLRAMLALTQTRFSSYLTNAEIEELEGLLTLLPETQTLRYHLVWDKVGGVGMFVHAKNRPLVGHEYISIYSRGTPVHQEQAKTKMRYYQYGALYKGTTITSKSRSLPSCGFRLNNTGKESDSFENVPTTILRYSKDHLKRSVPPTNQTAKPIALLEQLIGMYTTDNGLVVDPTAGSGSTAKAAMNLGRRFVIWERDPQQYQEIIEFLNSGDGCRTNPLRDVRKPKIRSTT